MSFQMRSRWWSSGSITYCQLTPGNKWIAKIAMKLSDLKKTSFMMGDVGDLSSARTVSRSAIWWWRMKVQLPQRPARVSGPHRRRCSDSTSRPCLRVLAPDTSPVRNLPRPHTRPLKIRAARTVIETAERNFTIAPGSVTLAIPVRKAAYPRL